MAVRASSCDSKSIKPKPLHLLVCLSMMAFMDLTLPQLERDVRNDVRVKARISLPFDERGKILIGILGWQILYVQIGFAKILLS